MLIASAFATAVALAPSQTPTPTPNPAFEVSDLESGLGADTMHLATFDAGGDQSGEVSITSDGRSLDATFADGLTLAVTVNGDGEIVELNSEDPAEAMRRMTAIRDFDLAAIDPDATKGEVMCYAGLVGAGAAILTGNIAGVMVSGFIISCNCLELVNGTPTPGCD
jgi:hypothetical protein